jgi:hypothetical protein
MLEMNMFPGMAALPNGGSYPGFGDPSGNQTWVKPLSVANVGAGQRPHFTNEGKYFMHKNRVPVDGEGGRLSEAPVPSYGGPPLRVHPASDIEAEAVEQSSTKLGRDAPGIIHQHHQEVPAWLYEKGQRVRQDTPWIIQRVNFQTHLILEIWYDDRYGQRWCNRHNAQREGSFGGREKSHYVRH